MLFFLYVSHLFLDVTYLNEITSYYILKKIGILNLQGCKQNLWSDYSIEKHKELVSNSLKERGYDEETIKTWVDYIE